MINKFVVISDFTTMLMETPTRYELFCLLYDNRDKWYKIGLSLQVHCNVLDNLKHSQVNEYDKLVNVINIWLTSQSSPFTWETVITVIDIPSVNNKECNSSSNTSIS